MADQMRDQMSDLAGRCFCGAVTWSSPGPVLWSGHCHCESCRRATASPFTSYLGVPRGSVTWRGRLSEIRSSGGRVRRQFCGQCGTQLSYENDLWPEETHLYAASMDEPGRLKPEAHFHYAERLPWVEITDDLPKHCGSADEAGALAC